MKKVGSCVVAALLVVGAIACSSGQSERNVYSLYRNSVLDSLARYHIATFDADESEAYNHENCETARALFQAQPGVTTRFWCEKGRYKP